MQWILASWEEKEVEEIKYSLSLMLRVSIDLHLYSVAEV